LSTPYGAVIAGAGTLGLAPRGELLRRFPDTRPTTVDKEESPGRHHGGLLETVRHSDFRRLARRCLRTDVTLASTSIWLHVFNALGPTAAAPLTIACRIRRSPIRRPTFGRSATPSTLQADPPLSARGQTSIDERSRLNNFYIEDCSFWQDMKIILHTCSQFLPLPVHHWEMFDRPLSLEEIA
jgi:Bacterial sugar transferase